MDLDTPHTRFGLVALCALIAPVAAWACMPLAPTSAPATAKRATTAVIVTETTAYGHPRRDAKTIPEARASFWKRRGELLLRVANKQKYWDEELRLLARAARAYEAANRWQPEAASCEVVGNIRLRLSDWSKALAAFRAGYKLARQVTASSRSDKATRVILLNRLSQKILEVRVRLQAKRNWVARLAYRHLTQHQLARIHQTRLALQNIGMRIKNQLARVDVRRNALHYVCLTAKQRRLAAVEAELVKRFRRYLELNHWKRLEDTKAAFQRTILLAKRGKAIVGETASCATVGVSSTR